MLRSVSNSLSNTANIQATQAALGIGTISSVSRNINFNSANTDTAFPIILPAGFTRYRVEAVRITGASVSLTTATCGVFTAVAAGGTAVVPSGTAITVSVATESTNNNAQALTVSNNSTMTFNNSVLYFRVQTAQGSAATGNVTITIQPLS